MRCSAASIIFLFLQLEVMIIGENLGERKSSTPFLYIFTYSKYSILSAK